MVYCLFGFVNKRSMFYIVVLLLLDWIQAIDAELALIWKWK